jgi:hypothetical protein
MLMKRGELLSRGKRAASIAVCPADDAISIDKADCNKEQFGI